MTGSTSPRDAWGTRAGFILAAVGSAVGLGNMWRFAYKASEGGGAAFVLVYLAIVALVGIPLMTSEFIIGRLAQESPARAVRRLGGPAWAPLGWLFVLCGLGILAYYSVIAGWTMRYAIDAIRNAIPSDTGAYFGEVSQGVDAALYHLVFMILTITVVAGGVKGGLERANLIMMPLMFLILISLAIWAVTLPNGAGGYAYYLRPDVSKLLDRDILTAAAGQSFFSLSLGMGALMTYASYLQSKENLAREAVTVALSDFGVAFTSGLVVFPVIFSFGLLDQVGESTVGALFIALPAGFDQLGRAGDYVDTAFFVMLLFAALTSAISLLEVVVAALVDGLHMRRRDAAIFAGFVIAVLGLPAAFNTTFLGNLDALVGQFLLMVGGLFTAFLVGYRLLPAADAELAKGMPNAGMRRVWASLVRYVAPVVLIIVLAFLTGPTWDAVVGLVTYAR
ncbi:MAG: sodium-dependent transporter [Gemmatimonadota bacterium]|nr:sodium-dependent transporter [Gemmatimonadota bacterium]MDH4351033.1 sodium-dependent transporter [Gemmatimonadota bacterium]MDH5195992.1 sodium-dependent transporter [Gemmatimonadota bacterium]